MLQDVRYAVRSLIHNPGFTIVALLALTLGIGVNSAIFSVVHGVLLRPMPYPESERLVHVVRMYGSEPSPALSGIRYLKWAAEARSFSSVAAQDILAGSGSVTLPGGTEHLASTRVTPGFFETLGVPPAAGRTFRPEDAAEGAARVAVIFATRSRSTRSCAGIATASMSRRSYRRWRRRWVTSRSPRRRTTFRYSSRLLRRPAHASTATGARPRSWRRFDERTAQLPRPRTTRVLLRPSAEDPRRESTYRVQLSRRLGAPPSIPLGAPCALRREARLQGPFARRCRRLPCTTSKRRAATAPRPATRGWPQSTHSGASSPTTHPEHLELCQRILAVPFKRAAPRLVEYLEATEVAAILDAPDRATPRRPSRSCAPLLTLFNTGARVQEVLDLRPTDLQLQRPFQVRLRGKGRKERLCPLWPRTVKVLRTLLDERGVDLESTAQLFRNRRGERLTRFRSSLSPRQVPPVWRRSELPPSTGSECTPTCFATLRPCTCSRLESIS